MKYLLKLWQKTKNFFEWYSIKQLKIIVSIALITALAVSLLNYLAVTRLKCATVTLNYEEAKQGLNPDGSKFNIADIKSDDVLKNTFGILGNSYLSVDMVKDRITIDSKMPISAINQTKDAIAAGSVYNYNPSEFDIYYSQKNKLKKNHTIEFLEALSKAYYEYFINTYSEKNLILEFDGADDFEEYDYYEIYTVLNNKINSMVNYLGTHQEENATFHSTKTGYSFENLIKMLLNLRDKDLEKLRGYVIQNKISKDVSSFIGKQDYIIKKQLLHYTSNMQASEITNSALSIYASYITGVAFIPSVDEKNEYYMGRTKTGIDNLAMNSYDSGVRAGEIKKQIDERQYLIDKFSADTIPAENVYTEADKMIVDICVALEKISTVSVLTDNDYLSYKTNDYITFSLPERKLYLPVIPFGITFVLSFAILLAGYKLAIILINKYKKRTENKINEEEII